jgi:uncharacterized protein (TIGR03083 family)
VDKDEIVRAVRAERRRTLALVRRLEPAQFEAVATPGWRVREVVAHLITTDRATVFGSNLAAVFTSMERVERWNEGQVGKWADRPIPDLLLGLDRWGRRLARFFGAVPSPLYRLRAPSLLGRAPLGLLIWTRVYDEWVHRQDIRRALGFPDEDVDLAPVADFLLAAISVHTVPRVPVRRGAVSISLKDAPIEAWRYDLSSGRSGPEGDMPGRQPPDVRISAPAPAFVMAAAGRDSFRDLTARGDLAVEGDEGLAEAFLGVLRIV